MNGKAELIRFADDFIICFEHMEDAKRVMDVMGKRMERFGLSLHPEKTRLIDFRRPSLSQKGGKGPGSFDFLGFTVYWRRNGKTNKGWHVSWKTRKSRLNRAIVRIDAQCRRQMHWNMVEQHAALVSRLRGHFNYFGVNDNAGRLELLIAVTERSWHKWLNRRSQRSKMTWERFRDLLRDFPLPKPRVYVDLWGSP